MRRIFSKLLYEIEEENDVMLVTVAADRGSAPRGAGAEMLVGRHGRITGSVGGGAVEFQAEKMAMELLAEKKSGLHEFTLRPNSREDIGMQCGGDVTVLFAYVAAEDLRWSLLAGAVCDRIESGKDGWLIRPLDGGVPSLYGPEGLLSGEPVEEALIPVLCTRHNVTTDRYFAAPLPQFGRVVIFGGGHIAQALTPLLGTVDFRCVVLDNRPDYSRKELFPGAEDVICCDYEDIAASVTLSGEDYVIIMTNGHAHDLTVEAQVLRSPYAYLGVIGSRSKIAAVNQKLTEMGIDPEKLKTIHTPIGVSIRAVTPAEIAVSILGELILCRAEIREGEKPGHQACPMHGQP
ncbi:MAG: XdhC family protein [Oscillospiraceae bacterium]|nr:XdhC family protein [Oscillospiraceae bacterium]